MNFVFHSSDLFSAVLVVSMVSIMENNQKEESLVFYIIEHGITKEHQQKIKDLVGKYPNSKVVFIPMPNINEKFGLGLKQIKSIWLFDSYCRLFLGTLLPDDVDRVLYLDCDTLCNGSLHDFYYLNFGDNYAAGVIDCLSEAYYDLFDMDKTSRYCNSGMLLFNILNSATL